VYIAQQCTWLPLTFGYQAGDAATHLPSPVLTTTPVAVPSITRVPKKARFFVSQVLVCPLQHAPLSCRIAGKTGVFELEIMVGDDADVSQDLVAELDFQEVSNDQLRRVPLKHLFVAVDEG
jgi:hypothetical protein